MKFCPNCGYHNDLCCCDDASSFKFKDVDSFCKNSNHYYSKPKENLIKPKERRVDSLSHSNSKKCPHCQSDPCCCTNIQIENNPTNTNTNTVNPVFNINVTTPECPPPQDGICPPPTLPNESPGCEQARQQISGDVFVASNGWEFGFINVQQDFLSTVDPSNLNSCQGTFGGAFHLAPIEELRVISNDIRSAWSSLTNCPMLIWSTIDGVITLVYVLLESPDRFIVVPTTSASLSCPAYSICINSGG